MRAYGDSEDWSGFKIFYNSDNVASGWTEVTNLTNTKYKEAGGLGGKLTNEWTFTAVSARWWKIWANDTGASGVISTYEIEIYGP